MKLEDVPAEIIASGEKHIAEAEVRMFEDGLDFETITEMVALIRSSHRRTAEQFRDALPKLRKAVSSGAHFEPGELQALIFGRETG